MANSAGKLGSSTIIRRRLVSGSANSLSTDGFLSNERRKRMFRQAIPAGWPYLFAAPVVPPCRGGIRRAAATLPENVYLQQTHWLMPRQPRVAPPDRGKPSRPHGETCTAHHSGQFSDTFTVIRSLPSLAINCTSPCLVFDFGKSASFTRTRVT